MLFKKRERKVNLLVTSLCFIFLFFPFISAQTAVGFDNLDDDTYGVVITPPTPAAPINVSGESVNRSDFWDELDTPADISTGDLTDDNTYVEVAGDTMTGNLIVNANVTADYFFGDGSQLTGITATANVTYNNTRTVCKFGACDFNTIAAAMADITDASAINPYGVLVYPGIYNENITMTPYTSLIGVGGHEVTEINSSVGSTIVSNSGDNSIIDMKITNHATANPQRAIDLNGGELDVYNSYITQHTLSTLATDTIQITDADCKLEHNKIEFYQTGTAAGVVATSVIYVTGNSNYQMTDNEVIVESEDEDNILVSMGDSGTSLERQYFRNNRFTIDFVHASFAGQATNLLFNGQQNDVVVQGNSFEVISTGGLNAGMYLDTVNNNGTVKSIGNRHISEGFSTSYEVQAFNGDTIESSFDRFTAEDPPLLTAATYDSVRSLEAGNLTATGWFKGLFNWIIGATSTNWLSFNGSTLDFNETFLNDTIDARAATLENDSITLHADNITNEYWVNETGDTMTGNLNITTNLSVAGDTIQVTDSQIMIQDDGNESNLMIFNTASFPTAGDKIGAVEYWGECGISTPTSNYAEIVGVMADPSCGSEDGQISIRTAEDDVMEDVATFTTFVANISSDDTYVEDLTVTGTLTANLDDNDWQLNTSGSGWLVSYEDLVSIGGDIWDTPGAALHLWGYADYLTDNGQFRIGSILGTGKGWDIVNDDTSGFAGSDLGLKFFDHSTNTSVLNLTNQNALFANNVTAQYFIGDGSLLTGISTGDDSHLHNAANITNEYWVNESGDTMTGNLDINANLSVEDTIGIGTDAPNYELEVVADSPVIANRRTDNTQSMSYTLYPAGSINETNKLWSIVVPGNENHFRIRAFNGSNSPNYFGIENDGDVRVSEGRLLVDKSTIQWTDGDGAAATGILDTSSYGAQLRTNVDGTNAGWVFLQPSNNTPGVIIHDRQGSQHASLYIRNSTQNNAIHLDSGDISTFTEGITTQDNMTAEYFIGDGSYLTGIVTGDDSHLHNAANITNEYWVNESGDTMSGNLGIKIDNPDHELVVNGTETTGIRVLGNSSVIGESIQIIGNRVNHPVINGVEESGVIIAPNNRNLIVEIGGNDATDRFVVVTDTDNNGTVDTEVFSVRNDKGVVVGESSGRSEEFHVNGSWYMSPNDVRWFQMDSAGYFGGGTSPPYPPFEIVYAGWNVMGGATGQTFISPTGVLSFGGLGEMVIYDGQEIFSDAASASFELMNERTTGECIAFYNSSGDNAARICGDDPSLFTTGVNITGESNMLEANTNFIRRHNLRFTRAMINTTDTDANKDTFCDNEFGDMYVAAVAQEVGLYAGKSYSYAPSDITFANSTDACQIANQGNYTCSLSPGTNNTLACIYKYAPIRHTRQLYATATALGTMDTNCQNTFGSMYEAASEYDFMQYNGAQMDLTGTEEGFMFRILDVPSFIHGRWLADANGHTYISNHGSANPSRGSCVAY